MKTSRRKMMKSLVGLPLVCGAVSGEQLPTKGEPVSSVGATDICECGGTLSVKKVELSELGDSDVLVQAADVPPTPGYKLRMFRRCDKCGCTEARRLAMLLPEEGRKTHFASCKRPENRACEVLLKSVINLLHCES